MGGTNDHFGWSVCMFGNIALVGAPGDSHGNYAGNGSVDVFEREEQTWSQIQYIIAEDLESNAAFGSAVGIAGTHLVIGAPIKCTPTNPRREWCMCIKSFLDRTPSKKNL